MLDLAAHVQKADAKNTRVFLDRDHSKLLEKATAIENAASRRFGSDGLPKFIRRVKEGEGPLRYGQKIIKHDARLGIFITADVLGEGAFPGGFGAAPRGGYKLKCIMAHRGKATGKDCWLSSKSQTNKIHREFFNSIAQNRPLADFCICIKMHSEKWN